MDYYWARFKNINNNFFRFDTRVYLNLIDKPSENDLCIGAVVGKNPGSAVPFCCSTNDLQKIDLNGDKLLPNIRSIFLKSYQRSNKSIQKNSYIQVLNLIYVCNKDLSQAIKKISDYPNKIICDTEHKDFPFLWYVWGNYNKNLEIYKERFYDLNIGIQFYLDTKTKKIINRAPSLKDAARHTQGLNHELVIPYISSII